MKKNIIFFFTTLLFLSCSKIDTAIKENYYEDFQALKKNYIEYSDNDYNRAIEGAAKLFNDASLSEYDPQGVTISVTYRSLLDEAKKDNINDSIETERLAKIKKTMNKILSFTVNSFEFRNNLFDDRDLFNTQSGIKLNLTFKNNSAREIKKITGTIITSDIVSKNTYDIVIDMNIAIQPKSQESISDKFIVNLDAKNSFLQTIVLDSLHIEWIPSLIEFKDGKKISIY